MRLPVPEKRKLAAIAAHTSFQKSSYTSDTLEINPSVPELQAAHVQSCCRHLSPAIAKVIAELAFDTGGAA